MTSHVGGQKTTPPVTRVHPNATPPPQTMRGRGKEREGRKGGQTGPMRKASSPRELDCDKWCGKTTKAAV